MPLLLLPRRPPSGTRQKLAPPPNPCGGLGGGAALGRPKVAGTPTSLSGEHIPDGEAEPVTLGDFCIDQS